MISPGAVAIPSVTNNEATAPTAARNRRKLSLATNQARVGKSESLSAPKPCRPPSRNPATGHDELHGATKIFEGDFRKLIGDLPEGRVGDAVLRQALPSVDPEPAEAAVAVEDE